MLAQAAVDAVWPLGLAAWRRGKKGEMRLTVSRVGIALLITSLLLLHLLWSLHHFYDYANGHIHASKQSKNSTRKMPPPPPPPIPIASFPHLRPSQEWFIPIQQNTSRSPVPPTHSPSVSSRSSPAHTQYASPLLTLVHPKFTLPQGVSQPSSR